MDELVGALDAQHNIRRGEKGHAEHTWSEDTEARIVQISFQLVRNAPPAVLAAFDALVGDLSKTNCTKYLLVLLKLTAQTRDIIAGKGEYSLFYNMLVVWYKYYPSVAKQLMRYTVLLHDYEGVPIHPYGSWKDVKYMVRTIRTTTTIPEDRKAAFADNIQRLMLDQIRTDDAAHAAGNTAQISLASRWVPRQGSSFNDQFSFLSEEYFSEYIGSAKKSTKKRTSMCKAKRKAKQDFRKLCSKLNRAVDTVQIKQCGGRWSDIDPNTITSITRRKQTAAFQNQSKTHEQRSQDQDRIQCAIRYKEHISRAVSGDSTATIKGKRTSLYDMVRDALVLTGSVEESSSVDELNMQWKDNASQNGNLGNLIAMCDVSGSMTCDNSTPLYNAIGLAIRIAEKSCLPGRILTFSEEPSWVNLSGHTDFCSQVRALKKADWGGSTDFYKALRRILDAICEANLSHEEVKNMVLVILSDMQIDQASPHDTNAVLQGGIKDEYARVGMEMYGEPFDLPHIVFFNLRSTDGFPALTTENNVSMISGYSPVLLNAFCDKGMNALSKCTPWSMLVESLEHPRYKLLAETTFTPVA
jgi:Mg-chelatase subunit ChlD